MYMIIREMKKSINSPDRNYTNNRNPNRKTPKSLCELKSEGYVLETSNEDGSRYAHPHRPHLYVPRDNVDRKYNPGQ